MNYRREIDGLRAVAVTPVILFHAGFSWFSGGYAGVDVFFVISGYLITAIIISEQEAGRFSLVNFYERRARRILPALLVVMLACAPCAWLLMTPQDLKYFGQSLVATSTFASNILFWLTSGYFDAAAEFKPLIHTWSLAVEEQFYVVFPLFIIACWGRGKRWIMGLIIVAGLLSLWLAQSGDLITVKHPINKEQISIVSFYMTPGRVWELMIGALVAFFFATNGRKVFSKPVAQVGSLLGIALIAYSVFVFDKNTPFPSLYTLAPTVGAALIILFASPATATGKLLGHPALVGIGLISYSAYLWHQPLFAFARLGSLNTPRPWVFATLAVTSIALAYFTWRYVELPFRDSARIGKKIIFGWAASVSTLMIAVGLAVNINKGFPGRYSPEAAAAMMPARTNEGEVCNWTGLASDFPLIRACEFGDVKSRRSVVLYGDSHAQALFKELNDTFAEKGIRGLVVTNTTCASVVPLIFEDFGKRAELDISRAGEWHLHRYSQARVVSAKDFVPATLSAYYGETDPDNMVADASIASASSYVPYCRGYTSIVVFNFFKANYGIRDPILYRYSIWDGREVKWTQQFLLPADTVVKIADPAQNMDSLPERGTLVLEAFHPRIATPSFQLRYFVLFRDEKTGLVAGAHSLALKSGNGMFKLGQPGFRGFGMRNSRHFYVHAAGSAAQLASKQDGAGLSQLRSAIPVPMDGYIVAGADSGCPASIWHDGTTPHLAKKAPVSRKIGRPYTTFYIPDFRKHAPFALISSAQIGFQPATVSIRLISESALTIASREIAIATDNATIDIAQEFSDVAIDGGVNVVFEFDGDIGEFQKFPASMVHLYYRSPNGLSDQVHSYHTMGYYDDPFKRFRSYRCRKFAPYLNDAGLDFIYSIGNLATGGKVLHETSVRIRIFTDCGSEYIVQKELSAAGITNFRAEEILQGAPAKIRGAAIFQIEHETANFGGSWFAVDRKSGHVGVDHFTGG